MESAKARAWIFSDETEIFSINQTSNYVHKKKFWITLYELIYYFNWHNKRFNKTQTNCCGLGFKTRPLQKLHSTSVYANESYTSMITLPFLYENDFWYVKEELAFWQLSDMWMTFNFFSLTLSNKVEIVSHMFYLWVADQIQGEMSCS